MTDGTTTWSYTYNADGLRTSKTNGTETWNYVYNGSQLTQMTKGNDTLYFTYDASGTPLTLTYNGNIFYYETNLQGDVVRIRSYFGTSIVEYSYDAWGKVRSITGTAKDTIGKNNPLLYRGYVYDQETELYYLQSRYYDPEIGRFINADDVDLLGANGDFVSLNLFAYCGNNPICRIDIDGYWWTYAMAGGAAVSSFVSFSSIGAAIATAIGAITPIGWVAIGTVAVGVVVGVVGGIVYAKGKSRSKSEVDPYARPGQKKQGRENKNKNRQKGNYEPRNNRRDGKPAPPKHHTPNRDHQRFSQSRGTKYDMLFKKLDRTVIGVKL